MRTVDQSGHPRSAPRRAVSQAPSGSGRCGSGSGRSSKASRSRRGRNKGGVADVSDDGHDLPDGEGTEPISLGRVERELAAGGQPILKDAVTDRELQVMAAAWLSAAVSAQATIKA